MTRGQPWFLCVLALFAAPQVAQGATVDSDGGITLWLWYMHTNPDAPAGSDKLNYSDVSGFTGEVECSATDKARATYRERTGDSSVASPTPHSCSDSADGSCLAKDKLKRDLAKVAEYLFEATEGAHWLRKVYVTDQKTPGWPTADVYWNVGGGVSVSALPADADLLGWTRSEGHVNLRSAWRACAPDVLLHELGHYLYGLAERYPRDEPYGGCFPSAPADASTKVLIEQTVPPYKEPTVMSGTFPHRFVDRKNATLYNVTHDPSPSGDMLGRDGGTLAAKDLDDDVSSNDGPNMWAACTLPFAQDEWTQLKTGEAHIGLESAHPDAGEFPSESVPIHKKVEIVFVDSAAANPGTLLLLDNSNSMNAPAANPASRYVQEAALFFYHSSSPGVAASPGVPVATPGEYVGAMLFNNQVSTLFEYSAFDPQEQLGELNPSPAGSTDIAKALEVAITTLSVAHGGSPVGANIMLLSDGRSTAGDDLWTQVLRANQMGIKIHTYSFGNADTATMRAIEEYSSASGAALSPESAEMKLDLSREVTTLRGSTAIYSCKGQIEEVLSDSHKCESAIHGDGGGIESKFMVPPGTRDLLFYVFLDKGNADELHITLTAPDDRVHEAPGDQPITRNGRFNGKRIPDAIPGEWNFQMKGSLLLDDNIEIVAYAQHPELGTRVWIEESEGGAPMLKAQLTHRYPLGGLREVLPRVYSADGQRVNNAGGKALVAPEVGIDDGVYEIPLDGIPALAGRDRARIDVEFRAGTGTTPARHADYEPGVSYADIQRDHREGAGYTEQSFSAFGTVLWSRHDNAEAKPAIDIYRLPLRMRNRLPNGGPFIGVVVKSADLISEQTRVSLGAGITPRVVVFSRRQRRRRDKTILAIEYKVSESATPGPRDLKLQYGDVILEKNNAVVVAPH